MKTFFLNHNYGITSEDLIELIIIHIIYLKLNCLLYSKSLYVYTIKNTDFMKS